MTNVTKEEAYKWYERGFRPHSEGYNVKYPSIVRHGLGDSNYFQEEFERRWNDE